MVGGTDSGSHPLASFDFRISNLFPEIYLASREVGVK
jgi:hypothetical protein